MGDRKIIRKEIFYCSKAICFKGAIKMALTVNLIPEYREKLLNNVRKVNNIVSGVEMPETDLVYSGWKVLEPSTQKPLCLKVLVPFQELIRNIEGMESSIVRSMPNKLVWFTLLVDQNASDYEMLIPEWDEHFIPTMEHVSLLIDVINEPCTNGLNRGYYGFGETGVGKTSSALWLMAVLRQPCVHMNCRPQMEIEEWFLNQIAVNGVWKQAPGPLMQAIMMGIPVIIDELDLAPSEVWPALNNLIEGRRFALPLYEGGFIQAHGCFKVIGFGNTGPSGNEIGLYSGRSQIDASVWDRFFKDYYESLKASDFTEILVNRFDDKISLEVAHKMGKFAELINNSAKSGEFPEQLSPRGLIAGVKIYLKNLNSRAPLLVAFGAVLGTVLDSQENLEIMLNNYCLAISSNSLEMKDVKKLWNERFKNKPRKSTSSKDKETETKPQDQDANQDQKADSSVS